jgi:hypothetical protein
MRAHKQRRIEMIHIKGFRTVTTEVLDKPYTALAKILKPKEAGSPLLKASSVLDVLEEEIRDRGFVGSADLPKLVFLCLYTRHFDHPVSLVIKGSSGSGKSFALKSALQFVPSTAYEQFAGMSERALIYNKDLDLKHRYLIIQEAAGLNEGTGRVFLRQLLSEGTVRYATVHSTKDGLVGEELPVREGPTGLLMTTTANHLHHEDETRMLSYQVDEDPTKKREALVSLARFEGRRTKPIDPEPWHALDAYVATHDKQVAVPYAERLAGRLPTTHNRIMRDFPHVLALIRAHALMHQCNRDRDAEGAIVATMKDYAAIHKLVAVSLSEGLETSVPQTVREVVEATRKLLPRKDRMPFDPGEEGVSQRQIADLLDRDRSVISRNVAEAINRGLLANLAPGAGRESRLVIGEVELTTGSALPAPHEIDEHALEGRKDRLEQLVEVRALPVPDSQG